MPNLCSFFLDHHAVFIQLTLTLREISSPFLSVPSLLPSLSSVPQGVGPLLPLISRPSIADKWSGGVHKIPMQRVQAEPGRQTYFRFILSINMRPFHCSMTNKFLCLLSIKRKFLSHIFTNSLSRPKTRFRAHNMQAVWGIVIFFGGGVVLSPKCLE